MKRVVSIALIALALLGFVAFVFIYLSLSNKQGQLNDQLMSLELELKTGAEKYTRCYYSVNNGSYMVGDVSLSHLRYDSTDAEKA
jgi:Trk-type K+ transport system membrane component